MGRENTPDHKFEKTLQDKKIPLLVLDQKWHHLFSKDKKPKRILTLEKKLNKYLGRQGHLNQELKELRNLKGKLMKNIMVHMDEIGEDGKESRRMKEDHRLISEINEKMSVYAKELNELPELMKGTNDSLMAETMEYCYAKMHANESEKEAITAWMTQLRIEAKKKAVRKQIIEDQNKEIYSYMHDIFGAQIIDMFDIRYEEEE